MPAPSRSSPAVSKLQVKKESSAKHPSGATSPKKRKIAIGCDDDEIQCLGSRPTQAHRAGHKDGDAVEYLRTVRRRSLSRDEAAPRPKKKTKKSSPVNAREEVRLSSFRTAPPALFYTKLARATSQRMFVIERTREGTEEVPEEVIVMAGSTGNLYDVVIGLEPSCTCPDYMNGNHCKHIIYVLHNVLKVPDHLEYQLALLPSELREIFSNAPIAQASDPSTNGQSGSTNRKEISGDCPICFTEFELEEEEIVWCRAACGNNIHKSCFEQWARTQKESHADVRCVYCRTTWQGNDDSLQRIQEKGTVNNEGYVNIGAHLGLASQRDTSTYFSSYGSRSRRRRRTYDDYFDDY